MKKVLVIVMALVMLAALTVSPALADGKPEAEMVPALDLSALDLTPSEGMEFESNGDGTCTLTGLGTCTDTDIVIPTVSPAGDTVTLIAPKAFQYLEDVDSVTLANYEYTVDEGAFQDGEFETLNIIGGAPVLGKYAFYDCEDLTDIQLTDSTLEIVEYAFQGCGDDAAVTFTNCTGTIGEEAFQYGGLLSVTFSGCKMEIDKYAFYDCDDLTGIQFLDSEIMAENYAFQGCGDSAALVMTGSTVELEKEAFQYCDLDSLTADETEITLGEYAFYDCEDLTSILFTNSTVEADEYAFQGCGDKAVVEMTDCSVKLDEGVFKYCSLVSFSASGEEFIADESVLYSCEDLETVVIDSEKVELGEYAISSCPDLASVSVCTGGGEVSIDDRAFQYCENPAEVVIGDGLTELGKYVFNDCAEGLVITLAGAQYTADALEDGLD